MIRERKHSAVSGLVALVVLFVLLPVLGRGLIGAAREASMGGVLACVAGLFLVVISFAGLFVVNPNEGLVLQLFGDYRGTVTAAGLRWANPFYSKRRVSQRVRNFESSLLKVNDTDGNPVEIAAVVVWRVVDTAEACFEVDDFENYVKVQSEAAVRNLATRYPYDTHEEHKVSLRGATAEVAKDLRHEIQERLAKAGVEVIEARLSHLAYAPEIAAAMLRRQQAGAIIAARQKIVEGAVGMVDLALERLSASKLVQLDEERKAAMVSNLLVVLCGDREVQPVVNTGSIYQ
ncbi:MAG TPA: SPFH domain-containing protein [Vicinamibacteria bacterium]|jgi:regulator of protease activity HflC (stomatin/prohibitin superfamily)|nr:SPFH domain-containing protein [Vicinamibacteria bacterium]